MRSRFFTNRGNNTLIKEFDNLFTYNPYIKNLDTVVSFLRAFGYFSLRSFLDNINKVRIFIGNNNVANLYFFSAENRSKGIIMDDRKQIFDY